MKKLSLFVVLVIITVSCGRVTFNMSGASIGNAKTCQINYFDNRADIFVPSLSADITDALKEKIQSSTSLKLVTSNADVMFEGEITGYSVQPQQVTASGVAGKDRLTISVRVRFTNELDPDKDYEKSFSRFQEYPGGTSLSSVEGELIAEILKDLIEDIFNEAFAAW